MNTTANNFFTKETITLIDLLNSNGLQLKSIDFIGSINDEVLDIESELFSMYLTLQLNVRRKDDGIRSFIDISIADTIIDDLNNPFSSVADIEIGNNEESIIFGERIEDLDNESFKEALFDISSELIVTLYNFKEELEKKDNLKYIIERW